MKYFQDESANGMWVRYAVAALPLAYLIVALLYSANSAPWGRQVDPESAYAMNGLAWAAGYHGAAARTRPTGYAYATLKRYTQTLHSNATQSPR